MKLAFLKRIEFWIILFFLFRMIGITNAPLESSHNWRQTTGLMVSRNFLEVDNNIFYPRTDETKDGTGIIGMEFPVMNYIFYLTAKVFGYQHWYGRLINLIVSSVGIWCFHQLLKRYFTKEISFYSSLLLLVSIWFMFSRKTMPDTFSVSLMFCGLLCASNYLRNNKIGWLFGFLILSGLGALSKIPAISYLPIVIALMMAEKNKKASLLLAIASVMIVIKTWWWYFVWNPELAEEFGNWYNSGRSFGTGISEILGHLGETFEKFYLSSFSGFIMFPLVVIGLVLLIIKKQKGILLSLVLIAPLLVGYMLKSGFYFYHHSYYIIPFVPAMAICAAYLFTQLPKQWMAPVLVGLAAVEGLANQQHDLTIKDDQKYKLRLEQVADKVTKRNDLVAISGDFNPQELYLAHRKGWNYTNQQFTEKERLHYMKVQGCKYIILDRHEQPDKLNLPKLYEDEDFGVYQLAGIPGI